MNLIPTQGKFLLNLARKTLEHFLNHKDFSKPKSYDEILDEPRGVFVTLTKNGELAGCIGHPYPVTPLIDAVMDLAISSATSDPRFPALKAEDLTSVKIEITVLTAPELIEVSDPAQYPHKIILGTDGLIIESGGQKGLLLPQVAPEWKWDETEFLQHTCTKAGLSPNAWEDPETNIYKFQGQIFKE